MTKSGTGTGTVTSDVGGISCGATCSANYPGNDRHAHRRAQHRFHVCRLDRRWLLGNGYLHGHRRCRQNGQRAIQQRRRSNVSIERDEVRNGRGHGDERCGWNQLRRDVQRELRGWRRGHLDGYTDNGRVRRMERRRLLRCGHVRRGPHQCDDGDGDIHGRHGPHDRGSESARFDRLLVRAGDQRARIRARGVSQSIVTGKGPGPGELVHVRYRGRWSGAPALVHGSRRGCDRTSDRCTDDLSEHRRQLQCAARHNRASRGDGDAELRHMLQRSAVVRLHRRYGPRRHHTVDAPACRT